MLEAAITWLVGNWPVTFIGVISFVLVITVFFYIAAFFQGRELYFWPPKIGAFPSSRIEETDRGAAIEWLRNSRDVGDRDEWLRSNILVVGVMYSASFFKDYFDVLKSRTALGRETVVLLLGSDGAAENYLRSSKTGSARVKEGFEEIRSVVKEADPTGKCIKIFLHDRLLRYSFIYSDQAIWVKFFANSAARTLVPALKITRACDLYEFFRDDVQRLKDTADEVS